ncbi:MAG TPA: hypothetical protein VKR31_00740, partial [Rhizomicrobium sp.]|nr:hypothetical protein [Rhizomicrobium sp.]
MKGQHPFQIDAIFRLFAATAGGWNIRRAIFAVFVDEDHDAVIPERPDVLLTLADRLARVCRE